MRPDGHETSCVRLFSLVFSHMSVTLTTRIRVPVRTADLVRAIRSVLLRIDDRTPLPDVLVEQIEEGRVVGSSPEFIAVGGFTIRSKSLGGSVMLLVYGVVTDTPWHPLTGFDFWAAIELSGSRTTGAVALGVATVVALAKGGNGIVEDGALAISSRRTTEADAFLDEYLLIRSTSALRGIPEEE